ncbi:hypothetical protein DFH06DRAFT_762638 [Mycena polygramma]|nr:hypothetical protein DFH06DRAFT_762638 [Mycena polygramma]
MHVPLETPVSIVAPALAKDIPLQPLVVITTVLAIPIAVHYASPTRLTDILEGALSKAKTAFADAVEAGHLSAAGITSESERMEMCVCLPHSVFIYHAQLWLPSLKRKVKDIKLETLANSRTYWGSVQGFLKGRTSTVLRCIWAVQDFETQLKVRVVWSRLRRLVD